MWHEGIQEAWNHYEGKNLSQARKILIDLNQVTRLEPKSLSEISFH